MIKFYVKDGDEIVPFNSYKNAIKYCKIMNINITNIEFTDEERI